MPSQNITSEQIDYKKKYEVLKKRYLDLRRALCRMGTVYQNNNTHLTLTIQKAINYLADEKPMNAYETLNQTMGLINKQLYSNSIN